MENLVNVATVSVVPRRNQRLFRWALLLAFAGTGVCRGRTGKELLVVVQNGKYGYIDHAGKVVIQPQFEWAEDFWRGLGTVYVCGRYVSIDSSATLLPLRSAAEGQLTPIPPQFDYAGPFANGLTPAKLGGASGFIDKSGKFAFSLVFDYASDFFAGDEESNLFIAPSDVSAFWTADGEFGYVNRSGRVIWGRPWAAQTTRLSSVGPRRRRLQVATEYQNR